MIDSFLCCFWWFFLGLILGWIIFWLFDKFFRRDGSNVLVEKEREIEGLKAQLIDARKQKDDFELRLKEVENTENQIDSAAKFGFSPMKNGEDNLTIIEGIGPKISSILKENGYKTFASVSQAEVSTLQTILDGKGPSYRLAKPGSWPKQAAMCVAGDWEQLKSYQDRLVNGVEFDD